MVLIALCGSFGVSAFAWDETGHKIAAYIAWQRMTPEVRDKVIKILRAAPEDSQIGAFNIEYGSRPRASRERDFFVIIATWPDMIKDRRLETRYAKYAKTQSDWHYTNQFWTFKDGKAQMVDGIEPAGQIMKKLEEFSQIIRSSATDQEKAIAVAWLEHLIGDLHQPLHTSARVTQYDPKGDRGGNAFFLTPKDVKKDFQDNLHSFWDGAIGRYMPNEDMCEAAYYEPVAESILKLYPYDKMKVRLSPGDFGVWEKESLNIAMNEVYEGLKFGEKPSDKYTKRAFEIAQERLALAGYRMGDLFNEAFGGNVAVAPRNAAITPGNGIACKIIRKVMYPVTKTSSVKQTLEISLLDLCPTQIASRPMYMFMIDGNSVMKEYDVVRIFKNEADARKYAAENKITDVSF